MSEVRDAMTDPPNDMKDRLVWDGMYYHVAYFSNKTKAWYADPDGTAVFVYAQWYTDLPDPNTVKVVNE